MGLHNRPYWQDHGASSGGLTVGLPKPGPAVKALLIANVVVYLFQFIIDRPSAVHPHGVLSMWLGVTGESFWQVWRYVTFQFLHDTGSPWHIILNMLGVYMLGGPLERHWGARRFATFYLGCGAAAGLAYVVLMRLAARPDEWSVPLIGASGGVYAIVLACAVLFPHFQIIFVFFPVPIRLAALIIFGAMIFSVLSGVAGRGAMPWSDIAHLGGAVGAALWVWGPRRFGNIRLGLRRGNRMGGAWQRKLRRQAERQTEIDRILQKIHDQGIQGLTRKERDTLAGATRKQREEERP